MRSEYLCRSVTAESGNKKKYLSDMGGGCGSFFSACLLGACGVSHFSGCQDKTEPLFLASRRAVLGFIMKVMKLKLHSPSFTGTASTALGGTTATWLHDHTFWLNLKVTYLFLFLSLNSDFKPHKTQIHYCTLCSGHGVDVLCLLHTKRLVGSLGVEGLAGWLHLLRPSTHSWVAVPAGLGAVLSKVSSFPLHPSFPSPTS